MENPIKLGMLGLAGGFLSLLSNAAFAQEAEYDFPPLLSDPTQEETARNQLSIGPEVYSDRDPLALKGLIPTAKNTGASWKIYKTQWSAEDETGFQNFITAIGRTKCATLDECLRHEANPYRDLSDNHIYLGDCADMAYFLRGYYAWKNGLPWSYQSSMRTADGSREDVRYSKGGNVVASRKVIRTTTSGRSVHAPSLLKSIRGQVSTAMFRTHPETGKGRSFDDFYPVKITRDFVTPGTIAYDVFGHVGFVYEVEDDGRVMVIASHPDNSVTRSIYGPAFLRTGPKLGSGLKAWRPQKLVGATKRADGTYVGGRIVAANNEDLAGYSLEQYFGNIPHPSGDWKLGQFHFDERTVDYYEYVRFQLAAPGYKFNPTRELRNAMDAICGDLKSRKVAVDQAVREGIHLQSHPEKLPPNIYGTYGTWEAFSTPSRDARLKTALIELKNMVIRLVEKHEQSPELVDYEGDNLPGDLLHAYEEEKEACKISYKRSNKTVVTLTLDHIVDRAFDLSFDPYHCPERRWGAKGAELSTCTDTSEKDKWYEAQKYLRNQSARTYDVFMGFRVDQLKSPDIAPESQGGIGVAQAPNINIHSYLLEKVRNHRAEENEFSKEMAKTLKNDTGATRQ